MGLTACFKPQFAHTLMGPQVSYLSSLCSKRFNYKMEL